MDQFEQFGEGGVMAIRCARCKVLFATHGEFSDHVSGGRQCPGYVSELAELHADLMRQMLERGQAMVKVVTLDEFYPPDEAKVAATAQRQFNALVGLPAPDPKPATPEPPEWKGAHLTIASMKQAMADARAVDPTRQVKQYEVVWSGDYKTIVEIRPIYATPDPIAEFNERRKAKREVSSTHENASNEPKASGRPEKYGAIVDASSTCLAKAMSTPLPHDPDIRTRVMPWRGR